MIYIVKIPIPRKPTNSQTKKYKGLTRIASDFWNQAQDNTQTKLD